MKYHLPSLKKVEKKSSLDAYFDRSWGTIIRGAHRLQILLQDDLCNGIINIPTVLVSGSNGKGTTSAFIESIMRKHGCKTGLYTSPHLIHPTERIRINGKPIDEKLLEEFLFITIEKSKKYLPDASFFELTTATAFQIFLHQQIEFLVCEVGLGGHYDSTNCLSPIVSVLTSVSLEHTKFLGETLTKIAADKSFISRRNRPFIVSETLNKEALMGVKETTAITGAIVCHAKDKQPNLYENLLQKIARVDNNISYHFAKLNLINLRTALCAVEQIKEEFKNQFQKLIPLNEISLEQAILNTEWPGRFDIRMIHNRSVIFDASHNPDGFKYFLNEYEKSIFSNKKCVLIFASLNDKDWKSTLNLLPKIASSIIFTEVPSNRAQIASEFLSYINENNNKEELISNYQNLSCFTIPNYELALETAMNQFPDLPLVITGSIAFIGMAMDRFGLEFHRGME
ncbi:bifunctional folylpolyglutamate synthase/dihydrofolate synthase [Silvanigrella aquatica]|uniref:Mur ligase central domain-containing protein n=1 Tax=Silvanigrella aquatica TaxID=1915309 RepID=A0A1L4CXH6_9BACT|nr:Mur ligase family protein [Silvanigrella aquatica]APJ02648.1 hypothetical protein AXG55_01355 [Silvanigrella aquatica]